MPLLDRVAIDAEVYVRGLPVVLKPCEHDSGDTKALSSRSIYRYVLLYIVHNAGRNDVDLGREMLFYDLSFFRYYKL